MKKDEFRKHAHELVDWMADYLENIEDYPVKSQLAPGDIISQIPKQPPADGEDFATIMRDFGNIIMPGMTHWQHPSFFAYFPGNSSPPSLLAEMLTATLGAQCMIWQTSPAAAELEEQMMRWLAGLTGLPKSWEGVIQDTASTATLCAILSAREKFTDYAVNRAGLQDQPKFIVYCSNQTHSSIAKAVKIAGLGSENLREIAVDDHFAMDPQALAAAIADDRAAGYQPLCVIATFGTTSSTAIDPLDPIGDICQKEGLWLHVDAAYAGSALILEEIRPLAAGIEKADSMVFNPHKWLFTNFDCSAYFVKDRQALLRTFEILPEYLKTADDNRVNNYRDWGIPLGRRFRALKLWFVMRSYGVSGLQAKLRSHLQLAGQLQQWIDNSNDFQRLAPVPFNLVCFRYKPDGVDELQTINDLNARLLAKLNATGKLFMTHTKLKGIYALRLVAGQTHVEERHIRAAWDLIRETARIMTNDK